MSAIDGSRKEEIFFEWDMGGILPKSFLKQNILSTGRGFDELQT
jgi:hypothetical protein